MSDSTDCIRSSKQASFYLREMMGKYEAESKRLKRVLSDNIELTKLNARMKRLIYHKSWKIEIPEESMEGKPQD